MTFNSFLNIICGRNVICSYFFEIYNNVNVVLSSELNLGGYFGMLLKFVTFFSKYSFGFKNYTLVGDSLVRSVAVLQRTAS